MALSQPSNAFFPTLTTLEGISIVFIYSLPENASLPIVKTVHPSHVRGITTFAAEPL